MGTNFGNIPKSINLFIWEGEGARGGQRGTDHRSCFFDFPLLTIHLHCNSFLSPSGGCRRERRGALWGPSSSKQVVAEEKKILCVCLVAATEQAPPDVGDNPAREEVHDWEIDIWGLVVNPERQDQDRKSYYPWT